ncbi:MAG TPA: DUF1549 and DUF1553 domain-containing protein [Gemmataceae bacterium]|nr:DUF1549 and DUF1553 domain-containing protein [Gemmataceae bacterium]
MPRGLLFAMLGVVLIGPALLGADGADAKPQAASSGFDRARFYTPPRSPALPKVKNQSSVTNPIDAFILDKLEAKSLSLSSRAEKPALLRRVTFDLTGLPPSIAEQEAFLADESPEAYRRVVDRLLASPHYGERWAQHWLDLVRYAETDGFKADDLRPFAYQYRDYVIKALNQDMPFDRCVRQQLAGDELEPGNPEALVATGLNRLWPDEYNSATLEQRRQEILDDMTDVTGQVFLGLTVGCARCHDHKFDPILQTDYYRLQAFFAPMQPRDDLPAADTGVVQRYRQQFAAWENATRDIRQQIDDLLADKRADLRKKALEKFRPEIQHAVLTPAQERTPYQRQIAYLAELQMTRAEKDAPLRLPADKKKEYQDLERRLAAVTPKKPPPLRYAMAMNDLGRQAPPTHRLAGGDWRKPREELPPGFPEFLPTAAPDTHLDGQTQSTGRRAALARWLTAKNHPLTARVLVNRLWQHHFGVGIVGTPNDFGVQGDAPSHPELLDWLAVEFMEHGWSLKHMHRLMVMSSAYCQTSQISAGTSEQVKASAVDPANRFLWHARRQRLEGEAMRDAMLSLSGELNPRMFGVSAHPRLPEKISNYAWKPDAKAEDQQRRSIYLFAKRNMRYPMFDAFDLPDMHNSCARRTQTTTAPQALLLLNGDFTLERARSWAAQLLAAHHGDAQGLVAGAYRAAWGRQASDEEIRLGLKFLHDQAERLSLSNGEKKEEIVADFCHVLMNANEFLYID